MSFIDFYHGLVTDVTKKVVLGAVGLMITGSASGIGWLISTTNEHTKQLTALTEDIHNLVEVETDFRNHTDSDIGKIVNVQEQQDREISALQQAMRDREANDRALHTGP